MGENDLGMRGKRLSDVSGSSKKHWRPSCFSRVPLQTEGKRAMPKDKKAF
jgi:hypothetical protein